MPGAKDLRDELRKLRNETMNPVSRMKMADCAAEIERLKAKRESTPPVSSTPAEKPKAMAAKIADVKVAKENEFPMKPTEAKKKGGKSVVVGGSGAIGETTTKPSGKKSKLEKLMAMLEEDDE